MRKYLLALLGCLFFLVPSLSAQQTKIGYQWSGMLGNYTYFGGNARVNSVLRDASGNTYVGGYFVSFADLDFGAGVSILNGDGDFEAFFAKINSSGSVVYAKKIGGAVKDAVNDMALDASGNLYITGYYQGANIDFNPGTGITNLSSSGRDAFFAKYDLNGELVFAKSLGAAGSENGNSIAVDATGAIYLTGTYDGGNDFNPGSATVNLTHTGGTDIFFSKYSAAGNYLFASRIGGSGNDVGSNIALDASGNIFLSGSFSNTNIDFDPGAATNSLSSAGGTDGFFAKYTSTGVYQFAKALGGTGNENANSFDIDGSGNIYVTGSFSGTADFDPSANSTTLTSAGLLDIYYAKYDASGAYQFAFGIGGASDDVSNSVVLDGSGNLIIAGGFQGTGVDFDPDPSTSTTATASNYNFYFAKYNSSTGAFTSVVSMGSGSADVVNSMCVDGNGNITIGGYFGGTVDFDPSGTTVNRSSAVTESGFWGNYTSSGAYILAGNVGGHINSYPSEDARGITTDASGNVVCVGIYNNNIDLDPGPGLFAYTTNGGNDVFVSKYDPSGMLLFAKSFGGTTNENVYNVTTDANGNIYVVGEYTGTVNFNPGGTAASYTTKGNRDIFVVKYNSAGTFQFVIPIGSNVDDFGYAIAVDASENIYITGSIAGTTDFDPHPTNTTSLAVTSADIFLAKYSSTGAFLFAKTMGGAGASDQGKGIALDAAGNIYVTGIFNLTGADFDPSANTVSFNSAGETDIFFAKYTSTGDYVYAKTLGGTSFDEVAAMEVDASGNVYLTGTFQSTADFDPDPVNVLNYTSLGSADIFFAKYNTTGDLILAKRVGGTSAEYARDLDIDASGNFYLTGDFAGTADFDPHPTNTQSRTISGNTDAFIAQYDASGDFLNVRTFGTIHTDASYGISLVNADYLVIIGGFGGRIDMDPSTTGVAYIYAAAGADMFLAKYEICNTPGVTSSTIASETTVISGSTALTDGSCRVVTTVAPSGNNPVTGNVTAQQWLEGSVGVHVVDPYVARHFEITPANNPTTATGRVTLYFTQQDFTDFNNHVSSSIDLPGGPSDAAGIANLKVVKYSGASSNGSGLPDSYTGAWEIINPADNDIVWNAALSRWEVTFDVTGFSGFLVQTTTAALPVTLTDFQVRKSGIQTLLQWTTSTEQHNRGFTIERSTDGRIFRPIGFVGAKGDGNSVVNQTYQYMDQHPEKGRNLYRLQQQDLDGKSTYSQIREIHFQVSNISVYPNPAGNVFFLTSKAREGALTIRNLTGSVVHQQDWSVGKMIAVNNLPAGIYILELTTLSGTERTRLVIK